MCSRKTAQRGDAWIVIISHLFGTGRLERGEGVGRTAELQENPAVLELEKEPRLAMVRMLMVKTCANGSLTELMRFMHAAL
ncbi:MAG: hypothetical protein JWN48_6019, partial [Myxococcaceae bacterium]|nr:hypothetical protein [Myxococcaceae bacterium]